MGVRMDNTNNNEEFNNGEYADGFEFWNDVKKYFYFLYLFIFLICLTPLFFGVPLLAVLFLELMTTPLWFMILMIRYVIIPHKSRLVKKIEEIQKERHNPYEEFGEIINCSARSPGSIIYFSIFLYLFILVLYIGVDGMNPPEVIFFFSSFLFFYAIILPAIFNRRKDRIWVDPRNQGYFVRKKYFLFLYGKKQFYNWSELAITVSGAKIELVFNMEFKSHFKPEDDDYLQIIPKAFTAFKGNDELDKMIALKAITMYNAKKVVRLYIAYGIVLTIALFEVFFLTNIVFG